MGRITRAIEKLRHRRVARLLNKRSDAIDELSQEHVSALRAQARAVHAAATRLMAAADLRLGDTSAGTWVATLPPRVDWLHRPSIWTTPEPRATQISASTNHNLGGGVTLHFDGDGKIDLRQIDTQKTDQARQGIVVDITEHSGSFASLAIGFPETALTALSKSVLFRCDIDMERPARIEIFARLNLRHGPNVEKIVRALEPTASAVDFDVFYADLKIEDVSDIWLDLIINAPGPARFVINDLVLSRRPRANV